MTIYNDFYEHIINILMQVPLTPIWSRATKRNFYWASLLTLSSGKLLVLPAGGSTTLATETVRSPLVRG